MIGPLELPDLPRWVEAHGIAADPSSWRRALARERPHTATGTAT